MKRTRLNWKGLTLAASFALAASSVGMAINEYSEYSHLDDALNNLQIHEDGKSFLLNLEGGVVVTTGSLYQTFDFAGRNIAMTGSLLGHELSAFNTFEAYQRPADIEQARAAGCRIAAGALNVIAEYDHGIMLAGFEKDRLDNTRTVARNFQSMNCKSP